MYRLGICISGDQMLIESACVGCGVDTGSIVHVRLSELTPEQYDLLAAMTLFAPGKGPRTPAEWRALAKRAASPFDR